MILTVESSRDPSSLSGRDVGGGENSGPTAGMGVLPRDESLAGLCMPRLLNTTRNVMCTTHCICNQICEKGSYTCIQFFNFNSACV